MECKSSTDEEENVSCELCNVHPTSVGDLQAHLRGKSHMIMVQRSEVAKRSVYVRGFSTTSTETDLKSVMGQFGGVVSVAMVTTDKDCYALVEFDNAESALRALQHNTSITLQSHTLTIKPRLLKTTHLPKRNIVAGRKKRLDVAMATKDVRMREEKEEEDNLVIGGIKLTREAIEALSQSHKINSQLEVISSNCRHKPSLAEEQLLLAWKLEDKLRPLFPSCIIIPFGAPFSGHGTLSSDCDLCLLSQPSQLDLSLFTGSSYLPPHLNHLSSRRPHPAGLGAAVTGSEPQLQEIQMVLQSDTLFTNVWSLLAARVPIIRFTFDLMHCDLSINNRLGLANTQLLAAYMNFDPRMTVLVPCVRLWMRGCGLARSQINNYAVSLLLIHSLQHTSPPVLPCLQELGAWPRNMSWYDGRRLKEVSVELDGWNCSFTDPTSLLPSSNTASPAELLLHFYHYYLKEFSFSEKMVTIHTLSSPSILSYQGSEFKVSSLCIQDPFERCHNITKSMKRVHYHTLMRSMQQSHDTLSQLLLLEQADSNVRQDVFSLFKPSPSFSSISSPSTLPIHSVYLSLKTVSQLLDHSPFSLLEGKLEELDLSNGLICHRVSHVILHTLTHHFQEEFGFRVHFNITVQHSPSSSSLPILSTSQYNQPSINVRKRRLEDKEEEEEEEKEDDEMEEEEEEEMEVESTEGKLKKQRLQNAESAEDVLLRLTEGAINHEALCVAYNETWIGSRRRRRKQETPSLDEQPPPDEPPLSLTLSVSTDHTHSLTPVIVTLQAEKKQFKHSFELFFSVCKKRFFT